MVETRFSVAIHFIRSRHKVELLRKIPCWIRRTAFSVLALFPDKSKTPLSTLGGINEALKTSLAPKEDFYAIVGDGFVYKPDAFKDWTRFRMKEILKTCNNNFREAIVRYDLYYNTLADNFMVKVDRASMAHALEVRCPFLDYRLIEFESKIPVKMESKL